MVDGVSVAVLVWLRVVVGVVVAVVVVAVIVVAVVVVAVVVVAVVVVAVVVVVFIVVMVNYCGCCCGFGCENDFIFVLIIFLVK